MTYVDWKILRMRLNRDLEVFYNGGAFAREEVKHYALIDAAHLHAAKRIDMIERLPENISLFGLSEERNIARFGPLLIPLGKTAQSFSSQITLETMRYGWTVSYISSTLSPEDLSIHLAGYLNGVLADRTDVVVRYYDTRLFSDFLKNFNLSTCSELFAPIAIWAWWDGQMKFQVKEGDFCSSYTIIENLNISVEQQEAMAVAATDNFIIGSIIFQVESDEFVRWLPHTLHLAMRKKLAEARALGLSKLSDLQTYVAISLSIHPNFFEMVPDFNCEQCNLREGKIGMEEIILRVPDCEWNRLGTLGETIIECFRQSVNQEVFDGMNEEC